MTSTGEFSVRRIGRKRGTTKTPKNLSLDNEALEWLEMIAKANRERQRVPNNISAVASKIILKSKRRFFARKRKKQDSV